MILSHDYQNKKMLDEESTGDMPDGLMKVKKGKARALRMKKKRS